MSEVVEVIVVEENWSIDVAGVTTVLEVGLSGPPGVEGPRGLTGPQGVGLDTFEYLVVAWAFGTPGSNYIGVGSKDGEYHVAIGPYDVEITRIYATLEANGAADWLLTLQDESSVDVVRRSVEENMVAVPAGEVEGLVTSFTNPLVVAGDKIRMDRVSAAPEARGGTVEIWGRRS